MSWILLLLSCDAEPVVEPPPPAELEALPAPRLLRRNALDLLGQLPDADDLDRVEADPDAVAALRADYLHDPRLNDRMVELMGDRWHTLVDVFDIEYYDYQLDPEQEFPFERAVGEEPMRLFAHVIANDLPWSEVVTADYTMANEMLADIWPLDYPDGATGWQPAFYTDGRPGVGVLSTNGLWWRYTTNESNMNRSRAAAITRLLLCEDFLARPVTFSFDEGVVDDPVDAVHSNPYCLACHAALDPIAASMFGFWWVVLYSDIEDTSYHPEREPMGEAFLGVEPAYFGQPMDGLSELGVQVANDPRFYSCAVEGFAESLWRRDVTLSDFETLEPIRRDFIAQGARPQALITALMETDIYRAGALTADASEATDAAEHTVRMMTPSQLAAALAQLTGFAWTWEGFDQLANDTWGYRVLAGGVDGYNVFRPQSRPGLTWALVYKRAAQGAAQRAVQTELVDGEPGQGLFQHVTLDTRPGDPAFAQELEQLHWRLYAVRADEARLADLAALWEAVEAESDPAWAWSTVVAVMLRDPWFVTY
ncbi:MAG: hypothetical protein H6739_41550 [Alphaproteobacteria bacterium]|nr:hypothetical protein [Alphaproteobacteria bacterium]